MSEDDIWQKLDNLAGRMCALGIEVHWPAYLASNLATAAGLCEAFYTGYEEGFSASGEGFNGEYAPRLTTAKFIAMAQNNAIGGDYGAAWKPGHALARAED